MNLFDKLTGKAKREEEARKAAEEAAIAEQIAEEKKRRAEERKAAREAKKATKTKSPKELATEQGEPWVDIISVELDPNNIGAGAFELDWNDKFVANLVRAGYKGKTDQQLVDQWFQDVCRNVILENFEQEQADPEQRIQSQRRKLDGGRTEFS